MMSVRARETGQQRIAARVRHVGIRAIHSREYLLHEETPQIAPRRHARSHRPVLIVGMPRSGNLSGRADPREPSRRLRRRRADKLGDIIRSAAMKQWSQGQTFTECADLLSLRGANDLAADYLAALESAESTATYVTDKMPMNYIFLGLCRNPAARLPG